MQSSYVRTVQRPFARSAMVVPTATVIASSAALVPTNALALTGLANFRVVGDSGTILMSCSLFGHSAACPKALRVLGLQLTESARPEFSQTRAQKQMILLKKCGRGIWVLGFDPAPP